MYYRDWLHRYTCTYKSPTRSTIQCDIFSRHVAIYWENKNLLRSRVFFRKQIKCVCISCLVFKCIYHKYAFKLIPLFWTPVYAVPLKIFKLMCVEDRKLREGVYIWLEKTSHWSETTHVKVKRHGTKWLGHVTNLTYSER